MDDIETPYDDDTEFIQCTVCDKSIRGETLYKIHLTTQGHTRKEEALVAAGKASRSHPVQEFENIIQYLDFLKIDEPIIGLSYLAEVSSDPQNGPKYSCSLCHYSATLADMVCHIIGRRHRQKYVEVKRPDLVTWDKQTPTSQSGKIIRARAEIIERQDGKGTPTFLVKRGPEAPPRQRQNMGRIISQNMSQDVPPLLPEFRDYKHKPPYRGRNPPGHPDPPPFQPESHYSLKRDYMEEPFRRADYRESDMDRREYVDYNYGNKYEENFVEDPQRRAGPEPTGGPRYDSNLGMPHRQAQHANYPEEAPPLEKRPYPEREAPFYTEEVRRDRGRPSDYHNSQPVYPEDDNHWWSEDRESAPYDNINRPARQGSGEREGKRWDLPPLMQGIPLHDTIPNINTDYSQNLREPDRFAMVASAGPNRPGPQMPQRQVEVSRSISDIPEPFRRFLKGPDDKEGGKRKRKSRFSDATVEEVEQTKKIFSGGDESQNPKFGPRSRPTSATMRPEIQQKQPPNLPINTLRGPHPDSERHNRGGSDSEGIFDMLKNIEIENAEEADFLKSKLCDLMKEFKTKKLVKTGQNSQSRAVISDYSLQQDQHPSPRDHYPPVVREDSDLRQSEGRSKRRGWDQPEPVPDSQFQEYYPPPHREPRQPNPSSGHYEEFFGPSETPRPNHPEEPTSYPERFHESRHPGDYRHISEGFQDSLSSASSHHMARTTGMDKGLQYAKKLDKITSTLMELIRH